MRISQSDLGQVESICCHCVNQSEFVTVKFEGCQVLLCKYTTNYIHELISISNLLHFY